MTATIEQPRSTPSSGIRTPSTSESLHPEGPTWEDFHDLEQRFEQSTTRRDGWTVGIFAFAAIAVLFGIIGIGIGTRAVSDSEKNVRAAAATATPGATAPPVAASPNPVTLSEFKVDTSATTIAAGNVTLQIKNGGTTAHELLVFRSDLQPNAYPMADGDINEDGPGITKISDGENLDPGATQTRAVDLTQPGTYLFVCNLPGHFKAGMYRVITVK